jgi:hypothetical protein
VLGTEARADGRTNAGVTPAREHKVGFFAETYLIYTVLYSRYDKLIGQEFVTVKPLYVT